MPHLLVVRTSRRGRDYPGSIPGVVMSEPIHSSRTRVCWGPTVRGHGSLAAAGSLRARRKRHVSVFSYVSAGSPRSSYALARAETRCCQMRYMPNLRQYAPMFRGAFANHMHLWPSGYGVGRTRRNSLNAESRPSIGASCGRRHSHLRFSGDRASHIQMQIKLLP
jgi:hypothetical protein